MLKLNPQIIEKDGTKEFVVLPYTDFLIIQEELEDYEDLRLLREAKEKEKNAPTTNLSAIKKEFAIH
jgi:hypothetical protein